MGATVSIALITWFASSLLEYRMGRNNERVHQILINPFLGVIFSFLLGGVLGSVAGAGVGIGVFVGNMLGLATNEFTFNLFDTMSRGFTATKRGVNHVSSQVAKVKTFKAQNPKVWTEATETIKLGFKAIGMFIMATIFMIGLPFRIYSKIVTSYKRLRGVAV